MKNFDLDYFIIEACKKSLYSKGIDLSYQEILDRVKKVSNLVNKVNHTNKSFAYLWTMYNKEPPPPPYSFTFETEDEAVNFADRVKKKYNVNCNITPQSSGYWRLSDFKKNETY